MTETYDLTNPITDALGDEHTLREVTMTNHSTMTRIEPLTNTEIPAGQTVLVRVLGDIGHEQLISQIQQINELKGFEVIGVSSVAVAGGNNSGGNVEITPLGSAAYSNNVLSMASSPQSVVIQGDTNTPFEYVAVKMPLKMGSEYIVNALSDALNTSTAFVALPANQSLETKLQNLATTPTEPSVFLGFSNATEGGFYNYQSYASFMGEGSASANAGQMPNPEYLIQIVSYFDFALTNGSFEGQSPEEIATIQEMYSNIPCIAIYANTEKTQLVTAYPFDAACTELYFLLMGSLNNLETGITSSLPINATISFSASVLASGDSD